MCELDKEDIHDDHPSHVISVIMQDKDNVSKLDELNLDDFAVTMYESNNNLKQHALNIIKMNSCGHSERCGRTIILGCPHYAYQGDRANASHWVRNILRVLSCIISGSKKRKTFKPSI